jgi:NADH dehydrogenase [ubiquinone] 1 alpha subcomplex assembly factor 7
MIERLDAFMARANAAYYATHDPFVDFTTSPEISQVFGELLGLWAAIAWEIMGRPRRVLLVEAGPGRGTLMADALRAVERAAPEFRAALSVHLIETSPRLRAAQAERVPGAVWHDGLATLPEAPLVLLANEFLDALPIRQFVRRGPRWVERYVMEDVSRSAGNVETRSVEGEAPAARYLWHERELLNPPPFPPSEAECVNTPPVFVENCESARRFVADLSARFVRHSGAALFLDYGADHHGAGESLQAIANGRPASPLSPPGTADLTAHVDFATLVAVVRDSGLIVYGPIPQGLFLARLGLFQRTGRLAEGQPPLRAAALVDAAQRLAEPHRMGRLFKAMAIGSPGTAVLPGFEP